MKVGANSIKLKIIQYRWYHKIIDKIWNHFHKHTPKIDLAEINVSAKIQCDNFGNTYIKDDLMAIAINEMRLHTN